jgi:hypothetical protein
MMASMHNMQCGLASLVDEIRHVVASAESDYSVRMQTVESQGYIHTLGDLLNRLTSLTEAGLTDIQHV